MTGLTGNEESNMRKKCIFFELLSLNVINNMNIISQCPPSINNFPFHMEGTMNAGYAVIASGLIQQ